MRCPHDKRSYDRVDLDYIFNEKKNTITNWIFNIVEIILCISISISLSVIILKHECLAGLYGIKLILITMLLCVHWFQKESLK